MKNKLKISYNSPVTLSFVFLCFLVLIVGTITGGRSTAFLFTTFHTPLTQPMTYLRFFTHVLGHSGWEHFLNNAAFLLLLGPMLEEKYGYSPDVSELMQGMRILDIENALIAYKSREGGKRRYMLRLITRGSYRLEGSYVSHYFTTLTL